MDWSGSEPLLTTDRLLLRAFSMADLPDLPSIEADPEVTFFRGMAPRTLEESHAGLLSTIKAQRQNPRMALEWCVRESEGDAFVGMTLLRVTNRDWREMEVGYALARSAWGRGYATEAVRATLAFAFQELFLHRVIANAYPQNVASHRVLEKLGFRREAYEVESYFEHGEWQDNVAYALLDREFTVS